MTDEIRVFIGYDHKEPIAYHVLAHSILRRSSKPVSITPLNRQNLKGHYNRPRGEYDSTDFSNSRWIVPALCDFKGYAIFMDCDMLCLDDIAKLWEERSPFYAVKVKKHNHAGDEGTKFLGQKQSAYNRKNWSSLVLFNNERCQPLTRHIVNTMTPGLWFHQFSWLPDNMIGELPDGWNHLVGVQPRSPRAKLVHYTLGGPWHGYNDCEFSSEWYRELQDMLQGENPVDWRAEFEKNPPEKFGETKAVV